MEGGRGQLAIDLFRGPQFFIETDLQVRERKEREKEMLKTLLAVKEGLGTVSEPDELVEGMSSYIMKVGFGTSFIDQEEELNRKGELP